MSIVLGIDPGSRITGYGIIRFAEQKFTCLDYGCIRLNDSTLAERLLTLHQQLTAVIQQHQPQSAAIEQVFMHKNAKSALILGHARGAALLISAQQQLPVHEYATRRIKQAVAGYGGANKAQVQHMVKMLLNLPTIPAEDSADALATAICHCHYDRSQHRLAQAIITAGDAS